MQSEKFGFKVGIKTDKKGWRDYTVYQWDWRHNTEIVLVTTSSYGSLKKVTEIARAHARLLESQNVNTTARPVRAIEA